MSTSLTHTRVYCTHGHRTCPQSTHPHSQGHKHPNCPCFATQYHPANLSFASYHHPKVLMVLPKPKKPVDLEHNIRVGDTHEFACLLTIRMSPKSIWGDSPSEQDIVVKIQELVRYSRNTVQMRLDSRRTTQHERQEA